MHNSKIFILVFWVASIVSAPVFAVGHIDHLLVAPSDDFNGDILVFPEFTIVDRSDQGPNKNLANSQVIPGVNLFYTADYQRFRFLGEWYVTTLTHNVERLQFGAHLGESSLWLGRFHNPIGYWNMQYHHAAFLQSTASRPGIMAFETQGGVIPNHLTGFLWEGIHEFSESGLYYTIGAGAGPQLSPIGLSPVNIFEPGGVHRPGASIRFGYQPVSYGVNEVGVSAAYTEIPAVNLNITQANQFVASIYQNWQFKDVHFIGEALYANNKIDKPGVAPVYSNFANAYGQADWDFLQDWTLIGRIEGSLMNHNDAYLSYFPKFVKDRFLGGIRYRLNQNTFLKFEASQDHLNDSRFAQVMFQVSAVFP